MHSSTLLAMLLALFTTVLAVDQTPWKCMSDTDSPLSAWQREDVRHIMSNWLPRRIAKRHRPSGALRHTPSSDLLGDGPYTEQEEGAVGKTMDHVIVSMDRMVSQHGCLLYRADAEPLSSKL